MATKTNMNQEEESRAAARILYGSSLLLGWNIQVVLHCLLSNGGFGNSISVHLPSLSREKGSGILGMLLKRNLSSSLRMFSLTTLTRPSSIFHCRMMQNTLIVMDSE